MSKSETYEEFVEKFKPKKTTDDCYTPCAVYDAVKEWSVNEYHLDGREIVRPFYPGGNYEEFDYPQDCIVIDNPPFSILSKIVKYYYDNAIDFFLFAPHLTLLSAYHGAAHYIVTDADITYENGAKVRTDFITNLGTDRIRTAPNLRNAIADAVYEVTRKVVKSLPKYVYPDSIISAVSIAKIADIDFAVGDNECVFVRKLDKQKGKSIFGGGLMISERKAAERKAAERKAATVWALSEREKEIIKGLGVM